MYLQFYMAPKSAKWDIVASLIALLTCQVGIHKHQNMRKEVGFTVNVPGRCSQYKPTLLMRKWILKSLFLSFLFTYLAHHVWSLMLFTIMVMHNPNSELCRYITNLYYAIGFDLYLVYLFCHTTLHNTKKLYSLHSLDVIHSTLRSIANSLLIKQWQRERIGWTQLTGL